MTLISLSKCIRLVVGNSQWTKCVGDLNKTVWSQPHITQNMTTFWLWQYIIMLHKWWVTAITIISFTRWMLFCNVSLQFPAFLHWQQSPFTAYCFWDSPKIAHNVNKPSDFCHFTRWLISYCSLIYLPHLSVCACGVTWHTVKMESGVWQHCQKLLVPAMGYGTLNVAHNIHIQIHTVSWWVYSAFLSTLYWCSIRFPFAILWTQPLKRHLMQI